VVAGALTIINNSLASLNGTVGTVSGSFVGVKAHIVPMPVQLSSINETLTRTHDALSPVPSLADGIAASLTSVDTALELTDLSVSETSRVFASVLSSFNGVGVELGDVAGPPDRTGIEHLDGTITALNAGPLAGIEHHASASVQSAVSLRQNLQGVCAGVTLGVLNTVAGILHSAAGDSC
jgi:hypothetical protein